MWGRLAKLLGLCGGMRRALEPVRATQGSQRALSPPGPRGAELGGAEGAGFGDQDVAWHSPTSAEPLCPRGSPQTWHCRRERIQGPTGEPESYVGAAAPRALHSPPAPAGSLCLGGSKVRGMSLILSPSGHCHLLAMRGQELWLLNLTFCL